MAKPVRAGTSGKKPRHTLAQKQAAREAREKQARAQLKGRPNRPARDRDEDRGPARDGVDRRGGYPRRDDREGGYRGGRDDRQGGYDRPRREGGYDRPRREGGYQGRDDRQGGDDRPRREGGFQGNREGGFRGGRDGERREGGYQGGNRRGGSQGHREGGYQRRDDRQVGGFDRPRREGGFQGNREGGFRGGRDGERREGGFDRPRREGGFQGNRDGGFRGNRDGDRREGGFQRRDDRHGFQGGSRQGGYEGPRDGDRRPRWADEDRREWRDARREREQRGGGFERPERTFRAHKEQRDGSAERAPRSRSWEERRVRDDRFGRDDRRGGWRDDNRGGRPHDRFRQDRDDAPEVHDGELEREAADAAYRERMVAGREEKTDVEVTEDNGFAALGLDERLVAALARVGITQPFPIQAATIPDALAGKDLLGRGQTGSGKTMAFGLPMLNRLADQPRAVPHRPRALILTPTRELAMQIVDALAPLMRAVDKRFLLVAGGMSYTPQLSALERGVDVLVATPGRLIDLVERSAADLSEVEVAILDEADHMAEMGFVEAIREVLDQTPENGQRLLFSATLDHGVDDVAKTYLKDPVTHSTDDATASVSTMEHHVFLVHPHDKKAVTAAVANRPGRTVVFCRTKLGADRIALQLRESGVFAAALHGGLNQAQRTRVLDAFKAGTLPVLVATDVAARGIHVDDVSLVLQVDPPADHKDYLHRSGRTARAGEDGVVVTLALPHQNRTVKRLLDAAGVETTPVKVGPEDVAVIETAGGSVPDAPPIEQEQLDAVLRPARRGGQGGGYRGNRQGGGYRGNRDGGGYRGNRDGADRGGYRGNRDGGGYRGNRDGGGYRGNRDGGSDGRRDWSPRD